MKSWQTLYNQREKDEVANIQRKLDMVRYATSFLVTNSTVKTTIDIISSFLFIQLVVYHVCGKVQNSET